VKLPENTGRPAPVTRIPPQPAKPSTPTGAAAPADLAAVLSRLDERLAAIEGRLEAIRLGRLDKDWYSTEEVAALMDRAPWTVREWCRLGRVRAEKRPGTDRWVISRTELERLLNGGLLPLAR